MTTHHTIPLFSAVSANAGLDFEGAIARVLSRHWYVLGDEVANFEKEFAAYVGVEYCVSLANGTDALELALRSLGVQAEDKVAAVANAGFYGSTAIHAIGAHPLYVDIDARTMTMAPDALAAAILQRPKAIIVTHLYGYLADMEKLLAVAKAAGIPVVEDCAQAHGARREGRMAGSHGDLACFSFYPTKNLGALGDGGAVVTSDSTLAQRLRALRQYGWAQKYLVATPGGRNSRLDELQAAILRVKLPHLDKWNAERRQIASRYNNAFVGLPMQTPSWEADDYVAHLYVVRISDRDAFRAFLKERLISTDVHYPIPDHLQPAYPVGFDGLKLDVTMEASETVVSLPCFPGLTDAEIERVIAAVRAYFSQ